MDFTKLEGLTSLRNINLTRSNRDLRASLYIQFANTSSLQKLFSSAITELKKYVKENLLQSVYDRDILYSFFEEKNYETTMTKVRMDLIVQEFSQPLFPTINIAQLLKRSHQVVTKLNKIGYQHLYVSPHMTDALKSSTNTSDSESGAWNSLSLKKKLETCQMAFELDCDTMLKFHYRNVTRISGNTVHVDILIFLNKSICTELSEYLGLIYLEELLTEAEEYDMDSVLFRLNNKNAELYRLVQSYINNKLIKGRNNICLVHTLELWENICANYRAVISDGNDMLLYRESIETANFHVEFKGTHPSMSVYIEAVSFIIDKALGCNAHVDGKYPFGENSIYEVKLPLISIIPLYVLRYFTQCKIKEQNLSLI